MRRNDYGAGPPEKESERVPGRKRARDLTFEPRSSVQDSCQSLQSVLKPLDQYHDNDGGNAELFIDRYCPVLRYIHPLERWFLWNGNRWVPDDAERIKQLVLRLSKQLVLESIEAMGKPVREALMRPIRIGDQGKISSMLLLARSDPRVVIKRDAINTDNLLLGVQNGVVDLRTGQLRDGQKDDFITKSCGTIYQPDAQCPRWLSFMDETFASDNELIQYMQRIVGYTLSGSTADQSLFFLYGSGANGKSTFIKTFQRLLGDYARSASPNILTLARNSKEPLDEIAALDGYRMVGIAETGESRLAEVRIKQLTGGDRVTGKAHYTEPIDFVPKFKLWIFGNSKPEIHGVDYAMWRRIRLIPFNVQFQPEQQDPQLRQKLAAELPGILNWAIQGALLWQQEGKLMPPECVVAATEAYREESDILRDFINEKIVKEKGAEALHKDVYKAYKDWHTESRSDKPFSTKKLSRMFEERGYKPFIGGGNVKNWHGIRVRRNGCYDSEE